MMWRWFCMFACSLVLLGIMAVMAPPAQAFNIFPVCDNGGGSGSAVCNDKGDGKSNPLTGSDGIIMKAVTITAAVAGLAAVIIIILAGLAFMSSGGDPAKTKTAKATIAYTIVGLAIILLADSIISIIVSRL